MSRLMYLHGFNSSARSHKAQVMARFMRERGRAADFSCPDLPPEARQAIAIIENAMQEDTCFIGSSLGGFYATYLAEKHDKRAVLLNPAIDPHVGLRAYLGPQKNLHTGAAYELREEHLSGWEALYAQRVTPSRYLLLLETGDEVLDYRRALERYAGAEQVVVQGGDHTLQSFPQHLPQILEFADARSV